MPAPPTAAPPAPTSAPNAAPNASNHTRVPTLDWPAILAELDAYGIARTGPIVSAAQAAALATLYDDDSAFRSTVHMARHGFGKGTYKYLSYPLPPLVAELRRTLYPELAPLANDWQERMGTATRYPASHDAFVASCHAAGQLRPTPLLLTYGPGDYNCLHQDLYGDVYFPFQMVVLLTEPGRDFTGGEFTVVEQRPRMQSRVEVVTLAQGEGAIFAVRERPVRGVRGHYRVQLRHGVSRVRSGQRRTMGVIFHDAR